MHSKHEGAGCTASQKSDMASTSMFSGAGSKYSYENFTTPIHTDHIQRSENIAESDSLRKERQTRKLQKDFTPEAPQAKILSTLSPAELQHCFKKDVVMAKDCPKISNSGIRFSKSTKQESTKDEIIETYLHEAHNSLKDSGAKQPDLTACRNTDKTSTSELSGDSRKGNHNDFFYIFSH